MSVYSITVGFSPILYCYLIPSRASELLSLQPMFTFGLNIQICVHNISIIFVCACAPGLVLSGFGRRQEVIEASRGFLQLSVPMILIRLNGVANDETGDEDDRVIVVPEGPLEKLNLNEAEIRDYRSPKSEADPRPARTLSSSTVHRT